MKKYNSREEVPIEYKWDLNDFYKNELEYNEDYDKAYNIIKNLINYKGKLKDSEQLLEFLEQMTLSLSILFNLEGYAYLKNDELLGIDKNIERITKVQNLASEYSQNVSFFEPELLSFTKEEYEKLFNEEKLKSYKFYLDSIYREKEHILNENEEIIVSKLAHSAGDYESMASNLLSNENDYGRVFIDGENITIARNNFRKLMKNKDFKIRKEVYDKFYNKIKEYSGTIASFLNNYCKLNDEIAKIHHFDNAWDRNLFNLNLSNKVFETLKEETENNLESLHKYYKLRKKVLGLDELSIYDLSLPLSKSDKEYSIEEAQKIILEAIKPLGEDYYKHFKKIFDNHYIDYCQYKGKCSGGYSLSTYDKDSRILLSYNYDFDSISTIAHEGGHNVNHQYVIENNDLIYRMIPNIRAEVMSLTNECLLSNYMFKNGKREEKLIGLENIIDVIISNLFGAVREGKIEQEMYKIIEDNGTLTKENLSKLVSDSLDKYYGNNVKKDDLSNLSWALRSHYYSDYYLFSYAICVSVACNVAKEIINGNIDMLDKYMKFLSVGDNMWTSDAFKI